MLWLQNNWSLLVVLIAAVVVGVHYYKKFSALPSDAQLDKIREWLLFAVLEAEKIYSSGSGQAKLSYVYNLFLERFPSLVPVIPFELFSKLVDDVLVQMRHLLETNESIRKYVEGE